LKDSLLQPPVDQAEWAREATSLNASETKRAFSSGTSLSTPAFSIRTRILSKTGQILGADQADLPEELVLRPPNQRATRPSCVPLRADFDEVAGWADKVEYVLHIGVASAPKGRCGLQFIRLGAKRAAASQGRVHHGVS
jgi:hypothetical protein